MHTGTMTTGEGGGDTGLEPVSLSWNVALAGSGPCVVGRPAWSSRQRD